MIEKRIATMKTEIKYSNLAVIMLLFSNINIIYAQLVNKGKLAISSNTTLSTLYNFDNQFSGNFLNDGDFFVRSNFNNDGLVTFTPSSASGSTHFQGNNGFQIISGAIASEFYNVSFNNKTTQPAFLLSDKIIVYGTSDFYYGIIDSYNYGGLIMFKPKSSHINENDASYVDGFIEHQGIEAFEYPIGNEGFLSPSGTGAINDSATIFRTNYVKKNSNSIYPHYKKLANIIFIDNTEYWKLESNRPVTVDFIFTITWNEKTTASEILNGNSDTAIAILRWDDINLEWKSYTSAVEINNKRVTAIIDNPGIYTLGLISKEIPDDNIVIYNGLSSNNNDGVNDYFYIQGLSKYPDNMVSIYNRWGTKIYETSRYGINNNWFTGKAGEGSIFNKGKSLPSGTYFYILKYKTSVEITKERVGYLYFE